MTDDLFGIKAADGVCMLMHKINDLLAFQSYW